MPQVIGSQILAYWARTSNSGKNILGGCVFACHLLFGAGPCSADEQATSTSKVQECIEAFQLLNPGNEALQTKAAGMLIFPQVGKGQHPGINPESGEGILRIHGQAAGTYSIQTPSRSATVGVAYHRLVLLFMTPESLAKFRSARTFKISEEVGMAIIATGRRGAYNEQELHKSILAFEFGEEGMFDNLYLNGSVIRSIAQRTQRPQQ